MTRSKEVSASRISKRNRSPCAFVSTPSRTSHPACCNRAFASCKLARRLPGASVEGGTSACEKTSAGNWLRKGSRSCISPTSGNPLAAKFELEKKELLRVYWEKNRVLLVHSKSKAKPRALRTCRSLKSGFLVLQTNPCIPAPL